jgi:hypothetical protein
MSKFIAISLVLLISSCSHYPESQRVLEKRSGYESNSPKGVTISRSKAKVKKAWLHPHEMPTGDYFGGAWIYLLVGPTSWTFENNNQE